MKVKKHKLRLPYPAIMNQPNHQHYRTALPAIPEPKIKSATMLNTFNPLPPRIDMEGYSGRESFGQANAIFPLIGNNRRMIFLDVESRSAFDGAWFAGLGAGLRGIKNNSLYGFYFFADYNTIKPDSTHFVTLNPGVEVMTLHWDLRLNAYLPYQKSSKTANSVFGDEIGESGAVTFSGHSQFGELFDITDEVGRGVDFSVGRSFMRANRLRFYVGAYRYRFQYSQDMLGIQAGLVYQLTPMLSVGLHGSQDNVFHHAISAMLQFVLGRKSTHAITSVEQRMRDPIQRHLGTLNTGSGIPSQRVILDEGRSAVELTNIWFFDGSLLQNGQGSNGLNLDPSLCTAENPCSSADLTQANVTSIGQGAYLYFTPSTYDLSAISGGLDLFTGQSMNGRTADFISPAPSSNEPVFSGRINLPDDSNLNHLTVQQGGSSEMIGISIDGASHINLNRVKVDDYSGTDTSNGISGISIANSNNVTLSNITISNISGDDGSGGTDGSDGTDAGSPGDDGNPGDPGSAGDDGTDAFGLKLDSDQGIILNNILISDITGGTGGDGGAGGSGGSSTVNNPSYTAPGAGGAGSTGDDGGAGGNAYGIYSTSTTPLTINTISVTTVQGGSGGTGGDAGDGGNANIEGVMTTSGITINAGVAGNAGTAGSGGLAGEAIGIRFSNEDSFTLAHSTINTITSGDGGQGGHGGNGGDSNATQNSQTTGGAFTINTDTSGTSSDGGVGGSSAEAVGIFISQSQSSSVTHANVSTVTAGNGGDGGIGGNGGDALGDLNIEEDGGGLNITTTTGEDGSDGGTGGNAGDVSGILIQEQAQVTLAHIDITSVTAGNGGQGGIGGFGGVVQSCFTESNNGGVVIEIGTGGNGGAGGINQAGGQAIGINLFDEAVATISNSTISQITGGDGQQGVVGGDGGGGDVIDNTESSGGIFDVNKGASAHQGGEGGSSSDGSNGGDAIGINVETSSSAELTGSTISNITGGLGQTGVAGASGGSLSTDSNDEAGNGTPEFYAGSGGSGGDGGDGGDGGSAMGVCIIDNSSATVTGNGFSVITGTDAANAAQGGAAGNATANDNSSNVGGGVAEGGTGGTGGSGGDGGDGGDAYAINVDGSSSVTASGNTTDTLTAGSGGSGGSAGTGGSGEASGNTNLTETQGSDGSDGASGSNGTGGTVG